MSITYRGTSDFTLQSEEPTSAYNDLPTIAQVWKGAATAFATFWAARAPGTAFSGGFIVERRGRNQGMYPEISLTIALPPDFNFYSVAPSMSEQTTSIGRTVTTSSIFENYATVEAQRQLIFQAPQLVYSYWASGRPPGPRFTAGSTGSPVLLASLTVVKAGQLETGKKDTPGPKTKTYYGNTPSVVNSALAITPTAKVTSFSAEPIIRTPWYRCQDTVSIGYWSDF